MNPLVNVEHVVLLSMAALAFVGAAAWRSAYTVRLPLRLAMTATRLLGVTGLLVLLLNLGRWRETIERSSARWALLLDRSRSMETVDAGSSTHRSRREEALAISKEALHLADGAARAQVYTFADTIEAVQADELQAIGAEGEGTDVVRAGRGLLTRERGRGPGLRGIVLLTDGRQPMPAPPDPFALRAAASGVPVYPVVLGGEVPARDLAISISRRRYVGFVGQPVTLTAALQNERMGPVKALVELRDAQGRTIQEDTIFATNGQTRTFSFDIRPDRLGYFEYEVGTPLRAEEADRANNRRGVGVFALDESMNVLLLEGEPYWDTKFLSHLLRAQTNMNVTAVFRVSHDRFFRVSSDAALTAATSDAMPATDEELAAYDLVVLGRGSEYLIDDEQARRLERFVRDHGGCLFFARGKSYQTADSGLAFLEPVRWGDAVGRPYTLMPLLAGEQAGLFGGLLPDRDSRIWHTLPPLERAHRCEGLRSFTSVLAEGIPDGGSGPTFPALVSRRYGHGLVLLVNGDGLWKWGFYPLREGEQDIYRDLWVRLFQWAVSFAEFNPGSDFAIEADRGTARTGEPVRVRVSARAAREAVAPSVQVYRGERSALRIALASAGDRSGSWMGVVALEEPGIYRLAVETRDGAALGAQTTIQILPPPGETDELSADPAFLQRLAELSGGRMITRGDLGAVLRELQAPNRAEQAGDLVWDPAWDNVWFALPLLACFALEWYWRRRQGLL